MWEMGRKAEEWRLYMDERMKTQQIKERKGLNEKLDRMHEYNKREIELRINDLKEERRKELERIGRRREQEREGRGEERSWATEARRGEERDDGGNRWNGRDKKERSWGWSCLKSRGSWRKERGRD